MKKRILASVLVLAMSVGLLAGCGGGSSSSSDSAAGGGSASADGKIPLKAVVAQYGDKTADWWANFQSDFNAENEDIDLNVEVVSWDDIATKVSTYIKSGEQPDILNIDTFASYQDDGLLLPAQDYVSEETYAKFYPSFLDQSVVDGTVWAVPDLASARALYYNTEIFEAAGVEPPKTWDELTEVCEKIKAYDETIYPWGLDLTTDEGQAAFAYFTWNNGGGFVDDEGNWTLNSDKNVEAMEYVLDLVDKGYTNSNPATEKRYDLEGLFGEGKVAMLITTNAFPTVLKTAGSDVTVDFAPIPANGTDAVSAGVMDRFMVFDNEYDDAQLAAITKFFDYFYEDERYSDWVLMEGFLPATSAGGEAMAAADPAQKAWIDIVGSCKFYPVAKAEWADVKTGVIEAEQAALQGGDIKELLDTLQSNIAGE